MKKFIRTIFVLVLSLVSVALFACEEDEKPVFSAEDAIKVLLVEQDTYVSGDFTVPGKLHYKGTDYQLSWTSDNACLAVGETVNANGTYQITATRPETGKQTATLTASLTIGETNATKSFSFNLYPIDVYEISDAYKFKYANKTVKESFDLDKEFTYEGKKATITWEVPTDYASIITVENGKVEFEEVDVETPVQIIATFTYNNETAKRPFNFALIPATVGPTIVGEFADGDTFKFGLYQESLGEYLYFAGTVGNKEYYLATVTEGSKATDVKINVVEGGYHLSFVNAEGATKYLDIVASGTKANAAIVDAQPATPFTYNAEYNTFVKEVTVEDKDGNPVAGEYYLGTYNTYNTISASAISYAKTSYPSHMYILPYGPVAAPVAATPYKLALYQEGLGKTLYFAGAVDGYYLASTENVTEAVDVTIEEVEGGYHLSFIDAEGNKKYLELVPATKVNASIVDTPTKVWSYNKEYYTFTQTFTEEEAGTNYGTYYMGTYNTFTTISASLVKYAASSYPTHMYAEGSDLPKPVEMTITEALAAEDGSLVIVTGTVKSIDTAWDSSFGNMSVTIEDEAGNTLYVYRLKTLVEVGDVIVVNGKTTTYNDKKQIAAGATAEIVSSAGGDEPGTEPEPTPSGKITSFIAASAAADGTEVELTGVVISAEAWSTQYKNMSVTIQDESGNTMYVFRLATQVKKGDKITVTGVMGTHNSSRQIAQGATAVIVEAAPEVVVPANAVSISFDSKDNRTVFTSEQQVWVQNGITVTNDKASSTNAVADYAAPARFYKNSKLTVACSSAFTKVVIECSGEAKYGIASGAITIEGATVSVSGMTVTIEFTSAVSSFVIESLPNQVRVATITVYTA